MLNLLIVMSFFVCMVHTADQVHHSESIARVITFSGTVLYREANSYFWEEVKPETLFMNYDEIETDKESSCEIIFNEGHVVHIDSESKLVLQTTQKGIHRGLWQHLKVNVGKVWIKLVKGTDEREQLLIETPFVAIANKNVLFSVSAPSGKISAYQGDLKLMSGKRMVVLAEGFESDINSDGTLAESQPLSNDTLQDFEALAQHSVGFDKSSLKTVLTQLRKRTYITVGRVNDTSDRTPSSSTSSFFSRLVDFFKK